MHDALISPEQVDDFIILRARALTSKVRRAITRDVLAQADLPLIEWQLLFSVARFGTCHLAYITQHTSLDPAHGSRAAAALEKKGLIERHNDPGNMRRKMISLTPDGVEMIEQLWPQARSVVKTVTDTLSKNDLQDIKRLLDLLNISAEALDKQPCNTSDDPVSSKGIMNVAV